MTDFDQQNDFQKAILLLQQQQEKLLSQQQAMLNQMAEFQKGNQKDLWYKIAALAPIMSGVIIAIGGTIFTLSYNEAQLKLQEVQTIERFIPHLLGDEKSKRAAILAISSLGDEKLAAKVASIFASPGTVSALESLAENDTSTDRKALKCALARAMDNMAGNYVVEKRYDDAGVTARKALVLQEQSFGSNSPELVGNLNRLAELCSIHKDLTGAETFLKRAADIQKSSWGPQSRQFASQLRRLAALYKDQGLDSKSQSILSEAIAIEEKTVATAGGASPDLTASKKAEIVDRSTSGSEPNSAGGADRAVHSGETVPADPHNQPSDLESTGGAVRAGSLEHRAPLESGVSKGSAAERSLPAEVRQELPGKSSERSEGDALRLRESAPGQPLRLEATGEKQR